MGNVCNVLSNLNFIRAAYKARQLGRITRCISFIYEMLASMSYHACESWSQTCIFEPDFHRKLDFLGAQWIMMDTALYLVCFEDNWLELERWAIFISIVGIAIAEHFINEPFAMQLIIAGIGLSIIFAYWIWYAGFKKKAWVLPDYDWDELCIGVALTAVACVLFATQSNWPRGYDWVHAVWHLVGSEGQLHLLGIKKAAPKHAVLDRHIVQNKHEQ